METLIMIACKTGKINSVKKMLTFIVDLTIKNIFGMSVQMYVNLFKIKSIKE